VFLPNFLTKIVAKLLIVLMIATNPAWMGAVQAADPASTEPVADRTSSTYTVDKKATGQAGDVLQAVQAENSNSSIEHLTAKQKEWQFGNRLFNYYIKNGKSKGPAWLKTTDFQINFSENSSPVYSIETIQPLGKLTVQGKQWFWQGRYENQSESATGNIGLGWRKLAEDKSSLIGFNVFYDYGFQYNLERLGVGAEYFSKLAEYRANWYYPLSNDRLTMVNYQTNGILYSYIRAVEGLDFEVGTSFVHASWLKIFAGGYYWNNKHQDDEKGYRLRSTMQLTPQMNMEVGYTNSNLSHSLYGNMKYQLAFGGGSEPKKGKQIKVNGNDLRGKLLQKVVRENDIKTETYTKFVWYTGSIKATVTNSVTNTPLYGATVQAYQNGVAVGSAFTTDASGTAVLSGLSVGNYTVHVTYAGGMYTNDSSSVQVTKDGVSNAAIGLAVSGGSANITVTTNSGMALSGATVTAIYKSSNTTVASLGTKILNSILGVQTAYAATAPFRISATTGASGVATFTNLPPGTYTFTVTSNGQLMTSEEIAVTSGGAIVDTVIVPTSGGNIRAVVKDSSGAAVSGAGVTVASGSVVVATATTDTNGVAIVSGIAAGSYTVAASQSNYTANSSVSVEVSEGYTSKSTLTLTRSAGSAAISVTFSDGATSAVPSFYVDSSSTAAPAVAAGSYTTNGDGSITRVYTISGLTTNVAHSITVAADHYTSSTGAISVTPTTTGPVTGSIVLTKVVYVTVTAGTHGTTTYGTTTIAAGATANIPVNYGSSLALNFAPNTYYKISGVTVGSEDKGAITSYTLSNITSSVAVSAAYTEITYQLVVTAANSRIQVVVADNINSSLSIVNTYAQGTTCTATLYASHNYTIRVDYDYIIGSGYYGSVTLLNMALPNADIIRSY